MEEIECGQRRKENVDKAIYLCEYIDKLPEGKIFGIMRKGTKIQIIEDPYEKGYQDAIVNAWKNKIER